MSRASHMARRLVPCLLLIAVWLMPNNTAAQTSLRVGVYDNKPKVFLDRDGNPQGIFIDILRTVADDEGWSLEFVPCTWDTCLQRLESGQIELMPDVAYSRERAQRFDFNDITILNNWAQLYANPNSEIASILDLEGRRLGVLAGDISYSQFANRLHAFDVECEFVEVDRFLAIFDSLDAGAIDAGLVSRLFGLEYERHYESERTPVLCCPVELRFAATKGQLRSALTLLDAHLLNLKSDQGSVYYQSFNRWLETDITPGRTTPYWIWWLLAGVGALVGLLLIHHGLLHMRLKSTTAELREKNQRLEAEIEVRSRAEEELRSHKAHLEQAVAIRTRELSESEKRYRSILENATVGIFRTTREGSVIMANPEVARLLGYDSAEQVVREVTDLATQVYYDRDDRQHVIAKMQDQGQAVMDLRLKRRDGAPIMTRINMWMVTDESGGLRFIEGVLEDITERKQAEERIRLYRQIFMGSSDGITITSCEGELLEFNPTMQKFLGCSAAELEGMEASGMCVPEDGERINSALRERGRFEGEVRMQHRNGSEAYVDLSIFPVYRDEGELACWVGIGRDVTERRETERALRQREEQYRGIFNNVIEGLLIFNTDGVVVEANPAACEMFGYTREEFIGKSGPDFVSDEALPLFKDFLQSLETQDYYRCETPERRSDGSLMYIEVNGTNFQFRGERHLLAVIHDITDRHQAEIDIRQANEELRTKQYQLIQSEKMASLGMLVAGVAHEINTPFGAVRSMHGTVKLAMDKIRAVMSDESAVSDDVRKKLEKALNIITESHQVIDEGVDRVSMIVRRLRSFARLDEAELKEADIHDCLEDTLTLIHHEIKHNITVERQYGDVPKINCFPSQLNQVFLNILINAKQAIEGKGKITITTSSDNGFVRVKITDDGLGMSEETLRRIFDPGFTTKGVGVGTGLGLSICYQIIQDHRGSIDVSSERGKGTAFTISIPTNLDESMFPRNHPS